MYKVAIIEKIHKDGLDLLKKHSNFDYEIIDRQLGRMGHLDGTRGHYDRSTLLDKRRESMEW